MIKRVISSLAWIVLLAMPFHGFANPKGIKHVILIGFDGWGAYSVPNADMPTAKMMMKKGAFSLTNRSVLPSSSAVNWASMLMVAPPELHGYTQWGSQTPELPSRVIGPGGIFPSVLGQLKTQKPALKTAVIYNWDGVGYLFEQKMTDTVINASKDEEVIDKAVGVIKDIKPDFLFIHFDEPDGVGHGAGHDTPAYYEQLEKNDVYLTKVLQAVKDAGLEKGTLIIVAADHGGINKGHGSISMAEMQTPLIFFGKGVRQQPEMQQSIMIYDIGATIAWLFDLKFPQVWTGRPIKEAFR
ncbi:MAG: alkaline phosphatase [Prolixibacteraceae bacterium]|nr:alkaline phosphatase [Prolixibacteraceae bacterium]